MAKLFFYNTLTRKKEEFKAIAGKTVGLYSCGPTVYKYAHLGNLRAFLFVDILKRTLSYNGYQVKHIMNITDVGHLVGDRSMGEDKLELSARKENKSAIEIARFYEEAFKQDLQLLNIIPPSIYARVTDHIKEQIELIKILEAKGYTYQTSDGLYFNTALVTDYNKLSKLPIEELKEGARVEKNKEKKNPPDFALWKFSPQDKQRQMEWPSPWGVGFPGWHIECSAISLKYLKDNLDIHCGGSDHINIHHTNEIAQSEAATGRPFFNYWLHNAFLVNKEGEKMSKSTDDFLTLERATSQSGVDPLAFRFYFLQGNYHKPMEYSEEGLLRAQEGLSSLQNSVINLGQEQGQPSQVFQAKFLAAVNNNLNTAQALAVVSAVLKSKLSKADKLATVLDFDRVLGLRLTELEPRAEKVVAESDLPATVKALLLSRAQAREKQDWLEADRLREEIRQQGYRLEDGPQGVKLTLETDQ